MIFDRDEKYLIRCDNDFSLLLVNDLGNEKEWTNYITTNKYSYPFVVGFISSKNKWDVIDSLVNVNIVDKLV